MSDATLLLVTAVSFLLLVIVTAYDVRRHRRGGGER